MANQIVHLTDRHPVRIELDYWHHLAYAQALYKFEVSVLEHSQNSRKLVFGWSRPIGSTCLRHSGYLLQQISTPFSSDELGKAIKQVCFELGVPSQPVFDSMPPVDA